MWKEVRIREDRKQKLTWLNSRGKEKQEKGREESGKWVKGSRKGKMFENIVRKKLMTKHKIVSIISHNLQKCKLFFDLPRDLIMTRRWICNWKVIEHWRIWHYFFYYYFFYIEQIRKLEDAIPQLSHLRNARVSAVSMPHPSFFFSGR